MALVPSTALLQTATHTHKLSIYLADHFFTRLKGLLGAPRLQPAQAMLLTRCASVHSCFMRQSLDLVYLNGDGVVVGCRSNLHPWRTSAWFGAKHVLEFAAGSIAALNIHVGARLLHKFFSAAGNCNKLPGSDAAILHNTAQRPLHRQQRGSAMLEFAVVAPMITLIGLSILQYGLIYFAKNQYNHAAFMAARAGSMANANLQAINKAYVQALIPLYGGGTDSGLLSKAYAKTKQATAGRLEIVMLNPTAESFADFNDPALAQRLGVGNARVIPNGGLAFKKAAIIQANSGQNAQDANLLKLRITHGYKPQVPIVGTLYRRYLQWLDPGTDAFQTKQIRNGFVPIVSNVTIQMQSDAIEGLTVSTPGAGNSGVATNSGPIPASQNPASALPPACSTFSCGEPEGGAATPGVETAEPPLETGPVDGNTEPSLPDDDGSSNNGSNSGSGSEETAPGGICEKPGAII